MAISTNGISQVDLSSGIKSKNNLKSKAEEGAVDSFSSLINMSSGNFKDENNKISENLSVGSSTNTDNTSNNVKDGNYDADAKTDSDNNINTRDGAKTEKADSGISSKNDSTDVNQVKETAVKDVSGSADAVEEKTEALAEQLAGLINQVRDILKDLLGIGDEEVGDAISVLDMNYTDLFNTENVNEFVLFEEGATEVDILIDEQLATLINDITSEINEAIAAFETLDIASLIGLEEESADINLGDGNIVNIKDLFDKANEIAASSDSEDEIVTVGEGETEGSFIPKNADNNISSGFNTDIVFNKENSDNKNASSQDFKSTDQSVINNLNNAINNIVQDGVDETVGFTEGVSQADIIRQVVDEIKANVTNDVTTLEMRLNPESLGRVQITVSSKNGVMQAQIVAETEAAKNAIEENIATLRETLNNQDLKVEDVEVTIASHGFFEGQEQDMPDENSGNQSNGKKIRVNSGSDIPDDTSDEEQLETEMMRAQGNSVSYTI